MDEDMPDLILALHDAKGPSDALDVQVALFAYPSLGLHEKEDGVWYSKDNIRVRIEPYTRSVDAALSLLPPGWRLEINEWDADLLRSDGSWYCCLSPAGSNGTRASMEATLHTRCQHGATMELAIVIACLRTRLFIARGASA